MAFYRGAVRVDNLCNKLKDNVLAHKWVALKDVQSSGELLTEKGNYIALLKLTDGEKWVVYSWDPNSKEDQVTNTSFSDIKFLAVEKSKVVWKDVIAGALLPAGKIHCDNPAGGTKTIYIGKHAKLDVVGTIRQKEGSGSGWEFFNPKDGKSFDEGYKILVRKDESM